MTLLTRNTYHVLMTRLRRQYGSNLPDWENVVIKYRDGGKEKRKSHSQKDEMVGKGEKLPTKVVLRPNKPISFAVVNIAKIK